MIILDFDGVINTTAGGFNLFSVKLVEIDKSNKLGDG